MARGHDFSMCEFTIHVDLLLVLEVKRDEFTMTAAAGVGEVNDYEHSTTENLGVMIKDALEQHRPAKKLGDYRVSSDILRAMRNLHARLTEMVLHEESKPQWGRKDGNSDSDDSPDTGS